MKKITFISNRGARVGHKFVEWLVGYIYCRNNNYDFYHHEFIGNSANFDDCLNLSHNENLFKNYKGNIIKDMPMEKYILSESEDLYIYDWFDNENNRFNFNVMDDMFITDEIRNILRNKYFLKNMKTNYSDTISVHIRRDDVTNTTLSERYINVDYFVRILQKLYESYPHYNIRIFSSNVDETFYEIKNIPYKNIYLHVDDSIENSLNYMINSKILITSNSGISFISSLLSEKDNIKICPSNFWHKWPEESIINSI